MVIKVQKHLIILLFILMLSGCNKNEYSEFEHYDLKEYDTSIRHVYMDEERILHEYVITDVTPAESLEIVNALFYKIADDIHIFQITIVFF